jgi:hypothetical protein
VIVFKGTSSVEDTDTFGAQIKETKAMLEREQA